MIASPEQPRVSEILNKFGLKPNKKLGQNFLTDPSILKEICSIANVTDQDLVLEIGAGLGHLTIELAKSARQVIAVEIDPKLIPPLKEALSALTNVTILQGDILQIAPGEIIQETDYLVVANIPYYITSRIIRNLLESEHKPRQIILTIQHEVAQRICSKTGKFSLLALSVLMYGDPTLELRVPAAAFFPVPKVDSAVIKINLHPEPLLTGPLRDQYFTIIKAGFLHKRKTLRNSLSKGLSWSPENAADLLTTASIDPQRRAETLSLEEWFELTLQYDKIIKSK